MQQQQLISAESATALLRASVNDKATVHGDTAKKLAAQLRERARVVREAVAVVRDWAPYHTRARGIVLDGDRLVDEAERQADRLEEQGRYKGPLRSQMTDGEKAGYIRRHGQARFLALPW